ncbi:TPA: hypothetical protein DE059_02490 [Candidatus Peribacteria bacterium]|jgi:hypothetical protein|nr:hypothetical protein [Candidatus Peribacteria bacterium]|tara:strand:- start:6838 stop:7053 length:216 start_codon:yes stop_codon:yes gene_type:complete
MVTGFLLLLVEATKNLSPNFLAVAVAGGYGGLLATICSGFDNLNPVSRIVLLFANGVAFAVGAYAGWFLLF